MLVILEAGYGRQTRYKEKMKNRRVHKRNTIHDAKGCLYGKAMIESFHSLPLGGNFWREQEVKYIDKVDNYDI